MNPSSNHFVALEQGAYQRLEHAASLKGLLKPFKGKGCLDAWALQCTELRDDLIHLALRQGLAAARRGPFNLLPAQLSSQRTGAGTTFLRWRSVDRSQMGTGVWEALILDPATPASLVDDLYTLELQRIAINLQISATHSLARQASECAAKMQRAETVYHRRIRQHVLSKETRS